MAKKVLGQVSPGAASNTDLYTVPASTEAVGSSLVVCNQSISLAMFRVAVRPGGASLANQHYIYYDLEIPAKETFIATIGMTLATTDKVTVYATAASLSFTLFGSEAAV